MRADGVFAGKYACQIMRERIHHHLQTRPRRIAAAFSAFLTLLALVAGSYAWAFGALGDSQVISDQNLGARPQKTDSGAINLLVMGIDDRTGSGFRDPGAGASDTTLLVHLYEGRKKALVVSIPRDTVVDVPECVSKKGKTLAPRQEQFNWAYSQGGPTCTVKTVEAITGVFLDHFVTVNLAGFKSIVDSLGGIDMCLKEAIKSDKAHVDLPAGCQTLDGAQALGYVRARYIGDGSDLSRITRQQTFLKAMAKKATTLGVIANPLTLRNLLESTANAIATDPGLSSSNSKRDLATSLRSLQTDGLIFVTAPVEPWAQNRNRVVFVQSEADALWQAIREDKPWPPVGDPGLDGKPLTVAPVDVRVRVMNGTATVGLAKKIADELASRKFQITGAVNADRQDYTATEIRYNSKYAESARTLAAAIGINNLVLDPTVKSGVWLVVGPDYKAAKDVEVPRVKATPSS